MIEAISCGGVVIFRGKILVLYKNFKNRYEGWVLPKGTVEPRRKVSADGPARGKGRDRGQSEYRKVYRQKPVSLSVPEGEVNKQVYWYLMRGESYYSKPQREEYFVDSGFYKYHEAYHLLRVSE